MISFPLNWVYQLPSSSPRGNQCYQSVSKRAHEHAHSCVCVCVCVVHLFLPSSQMVAYLITVYILESVPYPYIIRCHLTFFFGWNSVIFLGSVHINGHLVCFQSVGITDCCSNIYKHVSYSFVSYF